MQRGITRTQFVESYFHTDDGKPMDFSHRPYWNKIYNIPRRKLVLFTSRQSEKTTFIAKNLAADSFLSENDSALYTTASLKQVQDFSNKKLRRTFRYNKTLAATYLKGRYVVDNVFDKQLSNGSSITLRHSGDDGENVRGNTARRIYIDEKQSIGADAIPVIEECAATFPDDSEYVYAGTPLSMDNQLTIDWKQSRQYEWIIKCETCKAYMDPLGEQHIDSQKPYLFCPRCGKEVDSWNGAWVAFNPSGKYDGFRIVRLMVPFARWRTSANDGILDKLENYSEHRFKNEVLSLATESGFKPVTAHEIANCCDPAYPFITRPDHVLSAGKIYAGLDWAMEYKDGSTSFTKLGIFEFTGSRLKLLYAKTYDMAASNDPDWLVNDIVGNCRLFRVNYLGCDYGVGHRDNVRINKALNGRAVEFQYVNTQEKYPKYDPVSQKYVLSRTLSIEEVFGRIKKRWYHFPIWEQFEPFAKDILAEYAEYDSTYRRIRYDHPTGEPDDFLHVVNYATWVCILQNGM